MMQTITLNDGSGVVYMQDEELRNIDSPEFCVYYVRADDVKTICRLREQNYMFADRLMKIEINLSDWNPSYYIPDKCRFQCEILETWSIEKFYELAKDEFQTDRRFAVSMGLPDERRKKELLYQYICQLQEEQYRATVCFKEHELAGFNLWKIQDDAGTVLLGAVSRKLRGGASICLYEAALLAMKEKGAVKLSNRISTSNLAAVKLHMALGKDKKQLKITGFEDQYIKSS